MANMEEKIIMSQTRNDLLMLDQKELLTNFENIYKENSSHSVESMNALFEMNLNFAGQLKSRWFYLIRKFRKDWMTTKLYH
jgi:hypothetical protein